MNHRTMGAVGAGVALAASLLALGVASPAGAAATVNVATTGADSGSCGAVGSECRTITQAIANVDAGGTINVAAGTYVERVNITKPLTLSGAGQGQTVIGDGTRVGLGPGVVRVGATGNVTVQHLTVSGASRTNPSGAPLTVYLDSTSTAGTRNTISDVAITGAGAGGQDYGLYCEDSKADLEVTGSVLTRSDFNPMLIEGCLGTVDVHDNLIQKTPGTAASGAIFAMNNLGRFSVGNLSIRDNVVTGAGISVNVAFQQLSPGGYAGVSITGNQVTGAGISLSNQAQDSQVESAVLRGAVVSGNLLQGTGTGNGVSISGDVRNTTVEGNTISGYAIGLRQVAAVGTPTKPASHNPSGTVAVANRVVANTTAASTSVALNAENNWWGCNAVASCATFSGAVDADPNLVLTAAAAPASVPVPGSSTVTAGVVTNSAGAVAPGSFPNGAPVAFTTSLGSVSPASAPLAARTASTSVSSATPGTATVAATLDGQTASATVTFTAPPPPPGPVCKLLKITVGIPLLGIPPIVICI